MSNARFEHLQQGRRFRSRRARMFGHSCRSRLLSFSLPVHTRKARQHLSPQWQPQTFAFSLASIVPRFRVPAGRL